MKTLVKVPSQFSGLLTPRGVRSRKAVVGTPLPTALIAQGKLSQYWPFVTPLRRPRFAPYANGARDLLRMRTPRGPPVPQALQAMPLPGAAPED